MRSMIMKACRLAVCLLLVGLIFVLAACQKAEIPTPTVLTEQVMEAASVTGLEPLSGVALSSYFEFQDTHVNRFSVWVSASAASADTVAAFETRDEAEYKTVVSGVSGYLAKLSSSFKNTMDSEYQKIQSRVLVQMGDTVLLLICADPTSVDPLLEAWNAKPIY